MAGNIPPPPPGFELSAPPGKVPPPPPGFDLDKPPAMPITEHVDQTPDDSKGLLGGLWGMLVKPSGATTGGRLKMGLEDPVVGAAQFGAHVFEEQPIGYTAEQQQAVSPERFTERTQAVDQAVQQRERGYEEQRRQAVPGINDPEARMAQPQLATDWARLVGNVASPANIVNAAAIPGAGGAVGRGLPLAARLGAAARTGALAGGLGGLSQPVTEGDYGTQKLAQGAAGMLAGAAAGPAATAVGAGARALGGALPGAGQAAAGAREFFGLPAAQTADQRIQAAFPRAIGIPGRGINNYPSLVKAQEQSARAVNLIAANKDDLPLTGSGGNEMVGRLPQTRGQFAEAVHWVKDRVFQSFDALTKRADASTSDEPTTINKFLTAFQDASRREAEARQQVDAASRKVTLAAAQQVRTGASGLVKGLEKGGDVNALREPPSAMGAVPLRSHPRATMSSNAELRTAKAELDKATSNLERATAAKAAARADISRPWVDLKPVSQELLVKAHDPAISLHNRSAADYAAQKAEEYAQKEAMTASEAQRLIKNYNASLDAFYKAPSMDTASRASIDATIAAKVREQLDTMVSKMTGAEYQKLKDDYGALSSIEKAVTNSARQALNKEDQGFLNRFFGTTSIEQALEGMVMMNPKAMTRAVLTRVAQIAQRSANSPDRAVANMFKAAEGGVPRTAQPVRPPGLGSRVLSSGAGASLPKMPSQKRYEVGGEGPAGGIITAMETRKVPQ